jgi:hypothetical protein
MKYLCLIYYDEKTLDAMPRGEVEAVAGECRVYDEALKENGQLIACERLQFVSTAATLRIRDGRVSVTDGPFAETKEQLGGFYLIEARDMDEAVRLASKIPPARLGCIEVRPIWEHGDESQHVHHLAGASSASAPGTSAASDTVATRVRATST